MSDAALDEVGSKPGRLEVIALDGIPEVRPGDDLASLVGDALEHDGGCAAAAGR